MLIHVHISADPKSEYKEAHRTTMVMYSEIIFSVSGLNTLSVCVRVVSLSGLRPVRVMSLSGLCLSGLRPVQVTSCPGCVLSRLRPCPGCVCPGCVYTGCVLSRLCLSGLCRSTLNHSLPHLSKYNIFRESLCFLFL